MKVIEIKVKKDKVNANVVLKENGFTELSPFIKDNLFIKANQMYKIAHPVWTRDLQAVRIRLV